jgi:hypothetical protein
MKQASVSSTVDHGGGKRRLGLGIADFMAGKSPAKLG